MTCPHSSPNTDGNGSLATLFHTFLHPYNSKILVKHYDTQELKVSVQFIALLLLKWCLVCFASSCLKEVGIGLERRFSVNNIIYLCFFLTQNYCVGLGDLEYCKQVIWTF